VAVRVTLGDWEAVWSEGITIGSAPDCTTCLLSPEVPARFGCLFAASNHRFLEVWAGTAAASKMPDDLRPPKTFEEKRQRISQAQIFNETVNVEVSPFRLMVQDSYPDNPAYRAINQQLAEQFGKPA
jgi:hypothetical protein